MKKIYVLLIALSVFSTSSALAESVFKEEMSTDRPDFTEGTQTIEPEHMQLELGYTFIKDDENGVEREEHVLPGSLLRVGVLSDLEFRLSWGGYSFEEVEEAGASTENDGGTDLAFGAKYRLIEDGDFSLSLLGQVGLPAGARNKTSDAVEPQISFLWAYDLEDGYSLSGNVNFASVIADEDERIFEPSLSLSLANEISESLGAYIEYFGFYPTEGESEQHYLDSGLTYALSKDVQLDALVGFGLNEEADDIFTGFGLSFRH